MNLPVVNRKTPPQNASLTEQTELNSSNEERAQPRRVTSRASVRRSRSMVELREFDSDRTGLTHYVEIRGRRCIPIQSPSPMTAKEKSEAMLGAIHADHCIRRTLAAFPKRDGSDKEDGEKKRVIDSRRRNGSSPPVPQSQISSPAKKGTPNLIRKFQEQADKVTDKVKRKISSVSREKRTPIQNNSPFSETNRCKDLKEKEFKVRDFYEEKAPRIERSDKNYEALLKCAHSALEELKKKNHGSNAFDKNDQEATIYYRSQGNLSISQGKIKPSLGRSNYQNLQEQIEAALLEFEKNSTSNNSISREASADKLQKALSVASEQLSHEMNELLKSASSTSPHHSINIAKTPPPLKRINFTNNKVPFPSPSDASNADRPRLNRALSFGAADKKCTINKQMTTKGPSIHFQETRNKFELLSTNNIQKSSLNIPNEAK